MPDEFARCCLLAPNPPPVPPSLPATQRAGKGAAERDSGRWDQGPPSPRSPALQSPSFAVCRSRGTAGSGAGQGWRQRGARREHEAHGPPPAEARGSVGSLGRVARAQLRGCPGSCSDCAPSRSWSVAGWACAPGPACRMAGAAGA